MMKKYLGSKQENLVYLVLWLMLFTAPVLAFYLRTMNNPLVEFEWFEVVDIWKQYAVFMGIFLLHNFLLAPLLVYRQRRALYFSSIAVMMVLFVVCECSFRPAPKPFHHRPDLVQHGPRPDGDGDEQRPLHGPADRDAAFVPPEFGPADSLTEEAGRAPQPHRREDMKPRGHDGAPPMLAGEHDVVALIVLILMLGMNVGVKLYFKQRSDSRQLALLEKENLEQQLEYLKYQINPHFLMNTLNNIHALVDIDPEKAKSTIVELSKMMRFVLYEGSKATVPLDRELAFLQNYIALMKMRYSEKVRIETKIPAQLPDCEVPPLMLIIFVENAFKHGVSYRKESFIEIEVEIVRNQLRFHCRNSIAPRTENGRGGIGLKNVKRRLELIYGDNHTLNIDNQQDVYNIELIIPLL